MTSKLGVLNADMSELSFSLVKCTEELQMK